MKTTTTPRLSRRQFVALAAAGTAAGMLPAGTAFAQTRGGTIVCPINQDPPQFCPAFGSTGVIDTIGGKMFQGLFNLDRERNVVPVLAEAVDVSPDGLEYTIRLRKNVKWHDGAPLTADDVLFSMEVTPKFKTRTGVALSKVAETVKVDDHTLVFKFAKPYLPFVLAIAGTNLPIIPKHYYEGTDYAKNASDPIGTGPFKFKEFKRGEYVHLVRNEDYFLPDQPYIDELYFPIIPDASQRAISVETGQTNVLLPPYYNEPDLDRFLATGEFKVIEGANDGVGPTTKMNINKRHPLLGDVRFRKAITHAINRQQIVDSVYYGAGRVLNGPFARATAYHDPAALTVYDYNAEAAKALLDEMGLAPGADGMRAKIRITVPNSNNNLMRVQELVRQNLAEVGIDLELVALDVPAYIQKDTEWDYDLLLIGPGQFLDPDLGVARFLLSANIKNTYQANTGNYSNPKVDELWEKAVTSATREEAQVAYSEIQSILTEDVPDIWLTEQDQRMVVRTSLDGFSGGPTELYAEWGGVHTV